MKAIANVLLAAALVLGNVSAFAGIKKKLILGGAGVAAGLYAKHASEKRMAEKQSHADAALATPARVRAYNDANLKRFQDAIERSKAVYPTESIADIADILCGPAALYVTLGSAAPSGTFTAWVNLLREKGWLATGPVLKGMQARHLVAALEAQGLAASVQRFDFAKETARKAVEAADAGKAVFVEVGSDESFQAITGVADKIARTRHVVGVLGAQRDASGQVVAVALYDVNVYSGAPIMEVGPKFVPYAVFVKLLNYRFIPASLFAGTVITDAPVRAPVQFGS